MLLQSLTTGGRRWRGGRIDVSQSFLTMPDVTLAFQPREHCSNGGRAGRVREPQSDFLSRRAVSQDEKDMHDFALAACELFGRWCWHCRAPPLCVTCVAYCYICSMSRK